jgi:serine/threonine protein kinase
MNRSDTEIENLFAEAVALPSGVSRDEWIAARCGNDPALRREVESLLRAHDEAGDFLQQPDGAEKRKPDATAAISRQGTGVMNAATYAEAFLRNARSGDDSGMESYIAGLPESVRQEAQERIQAGLRVRKLPAPTERPAPDQKEIELHLPGFHIERKLGQGSLGSVYAAHDEKLNRRVAIKVLQRHPGRHVRRRVLEEARKAAALNDPSVVTIFSVLDETLPPAIVMEMVDGYPLDRFAEKLNFQQKAHLLREVARGLASAHERGLIHCDLKPDNIIVGPDMRPRILDFGIALSLEEGHREGRAFEGTPLYASPEQVRGRPLTAASDVFSFGSLMFKVLTGRAPFGGETAGQVLEAIATTAPPFLREVAVGVPEDLQAICLACLAWDPADRPTASEIALELGRFLVGEPVRLKPKLYDDLLRRSISEYSGQVQSWESQSIISREERDALETVHRRLLADEDHWIIDARRITLLQTILSGATWLAVVATVLTVWMLRDELGPYWRWALPAYFTATLFAAGFSARRDRDNLAAATFLAGAALTIAPCTLSLLAELNFFSTPYANMKQLFPANFTNQQVLAASLTALVVSASSLWRLRMTGFAWTTATLGAASYISALLLFNWLDRKPEIQALWTLPIVLMEPVALRLERRGFVRWTTPFHIAALLALVVGLDVMALNGPTLQMLGVDSVRLPYFDHARQQAFSFVLNGLLFLTLMLIAERSASLDLRRASKWLEVLAIVHVLSALFVNALNHRSSPFVKADVWFYLGAAALFLVLAALRSRWRMLVGGLAGAGLGCYLLVDLQLVERKPFIIGLGFAGLFIALGTFAYVRRRSVASRK